MLLVFTARLQNYSASPSFLLLCGQRGSFSARDFVLFSPLPIMNLYAKKNFLALQATFSLTSQVAVKKTERAGLSRRHFTWKDRSTQQSTCLEDANRWICLGNFFLFGFVSILKMITLEAFHLEGSVHSCLEDANRWFFLGNFFLFGFVLILKMILFGFYLLF